ncbi:MAG: Omp28-related outer membrane protein, partial [Phaeodactylibacter sp.]|nr:Omp28-related outer membrane protein [Phaeodactylibacter sp.]
MKKQLLTLFAVLVAFGLQAQESFSDDFETYQVGDLVAQTNPSWTTWTNSPGSAEDVAVTDEDAYSGEKSIKFVAASANGGPTDLILPFGDVYDTGIFNFGQFMKVDAGGGAYFNFQAVNPPGTTWAVEFRFLSDGTLEVNSDGAVVLTANYDHDVWFALNVDIDLTNNVWELLIDGDSQGTWTNNNNSIASMDLFPIGIDNGVSSFYVDDIFYDYTPPLNYTLDASVYAIDMGPKNIAGNMVEVTGRIRNLGAETLESFDITWTNGTVTETDMVTGQSIGTFDYYEFTHSVLAEVLEGSNSITVTVSNTNGMTDEDDTNDSKTFVFNGVIPAQHKKVYVEEATGAWCQWCPHGAVAMNNLDENFDDFFVGVAVHGGDVMEVPEYSNGLGASSFPSALVDRDGNYFNPVPDALEERFYNRVVVDPSAILDIGATWDETSRELNISVTATMLSNTLGDYRLNCAIIEDGVTGTTSDYAQYNAYSGSGVSMGGYENLPNPVPASMMVYNHVARAILGTYEGVPGSIPNPGVTGEVYNSTFNYTVPAEFDADNIKIVAMLIRSTGTVDNANKASISEAVANGFVGTVEANALNTIEFNPNPFKDEANLYINIEEARPVSMTLRKAVGQTIEFREFGEIQGEFIFPVEAANLSNGIYFVEVKVGTETITKRPVV